MSLNKSRICCKDPLVASHSSQVQNPQGLAHKTSFGLAASGPCGPVLATAPAPSSSAPPPTQSHIKLIFVADSSPWVFKEIKITNLQSYYLGPLWPFCLFLPILFKTCLYNPKISDLSFLKVKHNYLRIIQSYSQASRFIQIGLSSKISKQNKSCCMVHSLLRLI